MKKKKKKKVGRGYIRMHEIIGAGNAKSKQEDRLLLRTWIESIHAGNRLFTYYI